MTVIDPVCGMPVEEGSGFPLDHANQRLWFCTEFCRRAFLRHPGAYERGEQRSRHVVGWSERRVAYFSMEVALSNGIRTYAGGLGVLAGDTLQSLADLEVPVVAVSLVHRKGYFRQGLCTSEPFKALFDRRIPGWRGDPFMLRNAISLPLQEVWGAHQRAKTDLIELVRTRTGRQLRGDALTLGFARRSTAYKRPGLVFSDPSRLMTIARRWPLQMVFAGKAHPKDDLGKESISAIMAAARNAGDELPIVYLEDYDLDLALRLIAGTDLWLNTPRRPLEASGTSGMKAAHDGVPSFSVLDGWWREGHIEGATGWSIGQSDPGGEDAADARDLYEKLEVSILPLFYEQRDAWAHVMRQSIAVNASFFNSHRMVQQYIVHAYGSGGDVNESNGTLATMASEAASP